MARAQRCEQLLRHLPPRTVTRVHESLVCVDYIDRHFAADGLAARQEAVLRGIGVTESDVLPHFYRLLMEQSEARREEAAVAIRTGLLAWLAARPPDAARRGPFFLGAQWSAADIALFPWYPQRLEWIANEHWKATRVGGRVMSE